MRQLCQGQSFSGRASKDLTGKNQAKGGGGGDSNNIGNSAGSNISNSSYCISISSMQCVGGRPRIICHLRALVVVVPDARLPPTEIKKA